MNSSFTSRYTQLTYPTKLSSADLIKSGDFDSWCELAFDETSGVLCKRIQTPDSNHGFLLKYGVGSNSGMYVNTEEYELLNVRQGSVTDLITDKVYHEGDVVTFDKGVVREISCDNGAYVYCVMSKNKSELDNVI